MKTLLLMRHGKSDWENPFLDDHDRPLARRGQRAAVRMGEWLLAQKLAPDTVLMSSATRVVQTWDHVQSKLAADVTATPDENLYMIGADALISKIRQTDSAVDSLMIVNHEPTLSVATEILAKPPAPPSCTRAFQKFPTAAIARIELDIKRWSEVRQNAGRFVQFIRPKQLT